MALELPVPLTEAEIAAATKATRVPAHLQDPSLADTLLAQHKKRRANRKLKTANYGFLDYVGEYVPCANWLRTYKWRTWLLDDLIAGLAVAAMVIPQGMSYAQNLAFLPQQYGLYGAFVPCIAYAFLGSCKHLAVGPVAVTSLILGAGLTHIYGDFSINPSHPNDRYEATLQERFNHGAVQISFLAGCMYTAVGFLRLGWIVNYLSAPVISGFMTGAASIILSTQIKYITGMYILPKSDTVITSLKMIFDNMQLFRWPEFGMAAGFMIILILCQIVGRRYSKHWLLRYFRVIGPILVMIMSILITGLGKLYVVNFLDPATPIIKDIGYVPPGLGQVSVGWWFPLFNSSKELVLAAIICILDILESTTVARTIAQQHRYKLQFTQELRALGVCNLLGSCFNAYTVTGAFSRTSINSLAGARTQLSSFVTGITIMVVLLCATPLFKHMSINVQGAIVIVAVLPLLDFRSGFFYFEVNKLDFLCWLAAYLVTALAGALYGIATAFGLSIVLVVLKNGFPRVATVLGKLPDSDLILDPELYPGTDVEEAEGVLCVRVEAPLFFGNLAVVKDVVEEEVLLRRARGQTVSVLVMDMTVVSDFDGAVAHNFKFYLNELEDDGITLVLANPSKRVLLALQRASLMTRIRPENLQLTMAEAMTRASEIVNAPKEKKGSIISANGDSAHSGAEKIA